MRRNVKLTLGEELLNKVRLLAARRNRSVSALLRDAIYRLVAQDEAYEDAKRAALGRLERGAHLGGGPLPSRAKLHDRAHLSPSEVVAEPEALTLTPRDWEAFLAALADSGRPRPQLAAAARRYYRSRRERDAG